MTESIASVSVLVDEKPSLPRCPLCENNHWTPPIKVLDCGHSFCQRCLKSYFCRRYRHLWNAKHYFVRCPTCRLLTSARWEGVEQLPTNFELQHLLDVLFATTGKPLRTERPEPEDDTISEASLTSSNRSISVYTRTVWLGPYRSSISSEEEDEDDEASGVGVSLLSSIVGDEGVESASVDGEVGTGAGSADEENESRSASTREESVTD